MFTDTAAAVSSRFDEVMVDEYQDTNEVQDTIFKAVSKNDKNIFTVGDVKQSIYSFRQAMPQIFIERKSRYPKYNPHKDEYPASIILGKNFRSRKEITDSINFFFERLMSVRVGEIEYNEDEKLVAGADYPPTNTACVDICITESELCGYASPYRGEAEGIACKINKMIRDKVQVKSGATTRDLRYGDIAVLLRSPNSGSAEILSSLLDKGIPFSCEKSESFFELVEIREVLNLLRIISNPARDIPLLAVLTGPFFGFTVEEIAKIRINSKNTDLYRALLLFDDADNEALKNKIGVFLEKISTYRTLSVTVGVDEILSKIYDDFAFTAAAKNAYGENAENNLHLFSEYAADFEKRSINGLSAFVIYIDKLCEKGFNQASANFGFSEENCVKVMSIHKSKGLEFPVCIIANTNRKFNFTDLNEKLLIHPKYGAAAKLKNTSLNCFFSTLAYDALRIELRRNQISEELRVLYVALTRAKEKLVLCCSLKNAEKQISALSAVVDGMQTVPPTSVYSSNSYSEWILMCALMHPSAIELKKYAGTGLDGVSTVDAPEWNIEIQTNEYQDDKFALSMENEERITELDDISILEKYADFEYPYSAVADLPEKISVSAVAHKESSKIFEKILNKPDFELENMLTAALKGTAVHKFLSICDLSKASADMEAEILRLQSKHKLSEQEAQAVCEKNPHGFLNSALMKKIINSPKIYREFEFMVNHDASVLDERFRNNNIILQGAVDLAFVDENNQLVILDYKTDKINDISELEERYSSQLKLYKYAMEQSTGYVVSKCIIYSIYLDEELPVYELKQNK